MANVMAARIQFPSAAKPAARVDEATEGVPYRGDCGDLPPGAARERRGVGEDVFGRPGDKEHGEHDRFEPRRIFEPWDGPHLLAGEEQPDEPRAQGLHERYDGERSSECARKAKGGPSQNPNR